MNLKQIQTKFKTHEPYLLTCQEAGMSERWRHNEYNGFACIWLNPDWVMDVKNHIDRFNPSNEQLCGTAKFIAATNGERPVMELLWKIYQFIRGLGKLFSRLPVFRKKVAVIQNEILLALDAAGRLGWTERKLS